MKKYVKTDRCLVAMCLALFVFLSCGIAALCLLKNSTMFLGLPIAALLGIVSGVGLLAYAATAVVIVAIKKSLRNYLELSAEVVVAATLLISLSPLALILGVVELVCDHIAEKNRLKELETLR